jgi:Alkylmercury lyase
MDHSRRQRRDRSASRKQQTIWQPDSTVMVLGCSRSCEPSAHCARCPCINFHTSAANAHAYLQALNLTGPILTQIQALDLAGFLFGDLLRPVAGDTAGRHNAPLSR